MTAPVTIEANGAVLCGLLVPFHEPAFVVEADGRLIAEMFDEQSVPALPNRMPLLIGHDRSNPPAGIVTTVAPTSRGVGIEAELVGSADELATWRKRFQAGLMARLSVGFRASGPQQWLRPHRAGEPPIVVRRGVELVEASLVHWGAYGSAGIVSVNQRTAAGDESDRIIAETAAYLAETSAFLARTRRRR